MFKFFYSIVSGISTIIKISIIRFEWMFL